MKTLKVINFEQEFNLLYRCARDKADKFVGAAIREELRLIGPLHPVANLVYVKCRVFSVRFAIVLLTLILSALPVLALIRSRISIEYIPYLDLGASLAFLVVISLYSIGLWFADRTSAIVNDTARRQITADLIVEMWTKVKYKRGIEGYIRKKKLYGHAKGVRAHNVNDLPLAFKASLNRLKLLRDIYIGFGFSLAVFLNIYKAFVGDDNTLRNQSGSILQVGSASIYAVPLVFMIVTFLIIIFISGPLSWREQFEPFLTRAIEKRKEIEADWKTQAG